MMKRLVSVLLLVCFGAVPSLAGLSFIATPNQASYTGAPTTGSMALSVDLDAMPTGSIQFVTGPVLSATPIGFSFVAQAGATGPAPTIQSTSLNSAGGWNSIIPPTSTTFTAFNFTAVPLGGINPNGELIGGVNFSIPDIGTDGMFDLVATSFALDGIDMDSQVIGKVTIVGIPEPGSFLFLALVGSGIAGIHVWRRRG